MTRSKKTKIGRNRTKESARRRQDVENKIKDVAVGTSRVNNHTGLGQFRTDELKEVRACLRSEHLSEVPAILGAVILGHFSMVKRLLSSGTNVDARWIDDSTPLHWAVQTRNIEMAGLLIARGANPAVTDNNRLTPILKALTCSEWDQNKFMDLWNLVKAHPEMSYDACDSLGNTLLHHAVHRQWTAFVEMLLEKNASTEEAEMQARVRIIREDAREQTPLCYAVAALAQRRSGARILLQHLIDVLNSHHNLVCVEDYLKRRLEILLNMPIENRSMEKGILMVLAFSLRQFETGLEILLKLKIFYKIRRSLEKRISLYGASEGSKLLGPLLRLTSVLLLRCGCCGASVATRVPADAFITAGMANFCLQIIYSGEHESNVTLALTPIALAIGAGDGDGEGHVGIWLRLSFNKLLSLTKTHFNDILNVRLYLDEYHKRVLRQKLQQFHKVISQMEYSGSNFSKDKLNCKNEDFTSNGDNENKPRKLSPIVLKGYNKICQGEEYIQSQNKCNGEIDQGKSSNSALASNPSKKVQRKLNRHIKQRNARQKRDLAADKVISTASASTVLIASPEGCGTESNENEQPASSCSLRLVKSNPTSKTLFGLENDCEKVEETLGDNIESKLTPAETAETKTKVSPSIGTVMVPDYNPDKTSETSKTQVVNDANSFVWNTKFSSEKELLNETDASWKRISDLTLKDEAFSDISDNVTFSMSNQLLQSKSSQQACNLNDNIATNESYIQRKLYSLIKMNDNIQKLMDIEERIISLNYIFLRIIQRYEYHWQKDREGGYTGFCGCCGDSQLGTVTEQLENLKVILPKIEEDYLNRLKESWHSVVLTLRKDAVSNPIKCKNSYSELERILKSHKIRGRTALDEITNEKCTPNSINQTSNLGTLDITDKSYNHLMTMVNESPSTTSESELPNKSLFLPKKHDNKFSNNKGQKGKGQISTYPHSEEQKRQSSLGQNHSRWRVMLDAFITTPWISTGTISMAAPDQRTRFIISAGGNFGDVEMALGVNGVPLAVKHIPHQAKTAMQECLQVLCATSHPNLLTPKLEGGLLSTSLCEYNLGELLMCLKLCGRCVDLSALARQLLVGLAYLHRLSIVHGNLKPSNVLVDEGGILKLSEFGMHKVLYRVHLPPKSSMIWFAKETLEEWERSSSLCCDTRSDIQVAGMLVHFLLSGGHHPLGVAAEDILRAVRGGREPVPVAPPDLAHLLGLMLAPSPQQRPTALQALGHIYFWSIEPWQLMEYCPQFSLIDMPSISSENLS